jgi:hypothetical protein
MIDERAAAAAIPSVNGITELGIFQAHTITRATPAARTRYVSFTVMYKAINPYSW